MNAKDNPWSLVELKWLARSPTNPRKHFHDQDLVELAESIKAHGVLQPLLVRPLRKKAAAKGPLKEVAELTGYEVVDGERRYRAALAAGVDKVPVVIRELTDRQVLEIQIIANDQRADVTPLEKADGYAALIEQHGATVEEIAAKTGRSASTIHGLLKLRQLPKASRQAVEEGKLAASTAQLLARIPSAPCRDEAAKKVLAGALKWGHWGPPSGTPMSYREAKELIERDYMVELKGAPFDRKDADLPGGACAACPKRAGNDPELLADGVRADVCTDPGCFREKVEAWKRRLLADAEVKGQKVLAEKEAKKLFPYGNHLASDAPYYDLAEPCDDDRAKKTARSYKQLLTGHIQEADIVLCADPRGQLHRLVPKDLALPILRARHGLFKESNRFDSQSRTTAEQKKEKARRMAENRLRRETDRAVLQAAHDQAVDLFACVPGTSEQVVGVLRCLALESARHFLGNTGEDMCRRRGIKIHVTTEQHEAIRKLIHKAGAGEALALLVEIVAGGGLSGYAGSEGKDLLKALGISRKQIEQQVRKRLKGEKATKKGGKPAPDSSVNGNANGKPDKTLDGTNPVTLETRLDALLPADSDRLARPALLSSGLITVADLLDRAARVDPCVRNGEPYRTGAQLVYTALRETECLSEAAVTVIGDAIVDSGLLEGWNPVPPTITPPASRPAAFCVRCSSSDGAVVDAPQLADMDDDLIPLDLVDCELVEELGVSIEESASHYLCAKCLTELKEENGQGAAAKAEPKRKRGKRQAQEV